MPQAVRRVIPPLLNDFIGLQKDTALVSVLGSVDALQQANINSAADFNYTPYLVAAFFFVAHHDPAGAVHRLADRARATPAAGRRPRVSGQPQLLVEGLHKSFGKTEVLRGIDLEVDEHEVVCLIGASGSGKSTLLRCINLLEPIDSGRIVVGGRDITARGRRRKRGAARHRDRVPGVQPVPAHERASKRHARPAQGAWALAARRPRQRGRELLARFGLADKVDEYPDRLSGGQQQRVAIVRALAMRPRLMLLDEVTSALDPELVAEVLEVIRGLAGEGMTMVIATHEMGFARDIASRVCFLDGGVILEQGPPQQIFTAPREERTHQFLARIIAAGRM